MQDRKLLYCGAPANITDVPKDKPTIVNLVSMHPRLRQLTVSAYKTLTAKITLDRSGYEAIRASIALQEVIWGSLQRMRISQSVVDDLRTIVPGRWGIEIRLPSCCDTDSRLPDVVKSSDIVFHDVFCVGPHSSLLSILSIDFDALETTTMAVDTTADQTSRILPLLIDKGVQQIGLAAFLNDLSPLVKQVTGNLDVIRSFDKVAIVIAVDLASVAGRDWLRFGEQLPSWRPARPPHSGASVHSTVEWPSRVLLHVNLLPDTEDVFSDRVQMVIARRIRFAASFLLLIGGPNAEYRLTATYASPTDVKVEASRYKHLNTLIAVYQSMLLVEIERLVDAEAGDGSSGWRRLAVEERKV